MEIIFYIYLFQFNASNLTWWKYENDKDRNDLSIIVSCNILCKVFSNIYTKSTQINMSEVSELCVGCELEVNPTSSNKMTWHRTGQRTGTAESCSATALNINIRVHAAVTVDSWHGPWDNFDSSDNLCFRIIVSAVSIRGWKNIWPENSIKCPHLHSVCS